MHPTLSDLHTSYEPEIKWTNDCQGKKDYDGEFISVSTRYYPGTYQANRLCSASSQIGIPVEGLLTVLAHKEFEAKTEQEVKLLVESWVRMQTREIIFNLYLCGYGEGRTTKINGVPMQVMSVQRAAAMQGINVTEVLHTCIIPSQSATFFVVEAEGRGRILLTFKDGQMHAPSDEMFQKYLTAVNEEQNDLLYIQKLLKGEENV